MGNVGFGLLPRSYCSLPQKDANGERTDAESEMFGSGLDSIAFLYASPHVTVIQQKELPAENIAAGGPGAITYNQSGWCTFENAAAGLATSHGGKRFVLGENIFFASQSRAPPSSTLSVLPSSARPTARRFRVCTKTCTSP